MKRFRSFAAVLLAMLFVIGAALPAGANSALKAWRGVDGSSPWLKEGCPVEALHERLTIEVNGFPAVDASMDMGDASVTAEYTLHNPADEAVSVRLFFPVGEIPLYGYESGEHGVWVDGQPAEVTRRFSYPAYSVFHADDELEKLRDDYARTEFVTPETPVTVITYDFKGFSSQVEATLSYTGAGRVICCPFSEADGVSFRKRTEDCVLTVLARPGAICRLAVFDDGTGDVSFAFADVDTEALLPDAYAKETGRQTLPFADFTALNAPAGSLISPLDRYNAAADEFSDVLENIAPGGAAYAEYMWYAADEYFMEWYEYTLTFAPGQTLVNRVTAPFYPDIDMYWQPSKFTYTYLLSPAAGWAAFGALDVEVRTPFPLLESSLKGFEKTQTGWALHTDGLPDKELTFTLCETAHPKRDAGSVIYIILAVVTMLVFAAFVVGAVILIVWLVKKIKIRGNRYES